jgi:hypothetical protein
MNDRMTELYAGACLYAREQHPTEVPAFIACMAERFAELIVRECGVALSPMLRDQISRGKAFDLIKQHFGVEE